mmetsp:Transcript_35627/g.54487  ORF Transcript_35627/g.54487 Transcript_35627/m.54487 type:complete len:205 (+) Transcript_35627:1001-1615(+)
MYVEGPDQNYIAHGYNEYSVKAYVNSAVCTAKGQKTVSFKDGQTIKFNNPSDTFYNIVMGTLYQWITGKMEFHDEANDLYGFYEIGSVKGKSQEYFQGEIVHKGESVSKVYGNYNGYMDFDGVRFFDIREVDSVYHELEDIPTSSSLPSDSMKRKDLMLLKEDETEAAQSAKEEIEQLQRADKAGRVKAEKRRSEGGEQMVLPA